MAMRMKRARNISDEVLEQRQEAVQALLNRPWILKSSHPELYAIIKDQYTWLRDWFYQHPGYSLLLTRTFAKLEKVPGAFYPWMGIDGFSSPRDYAFFTYGLWYLEGRGDSEQFLLTEMVESIREHLVTVGIFVDWTLYDHRQSMARALKKLRELGVLVAVEGEETNWARDGGDEANVLYESSPMARYVMRRFPRDFTSYTSLEELIQEAERPYFGPEDEMSANAHVERRRHQVFRRLLLEPVVYNSQWSDPELRYLQLQRPWVFGQLEQATGLVGRRFREGVFVSWPQLTGEMDLFPTLAAVSDLVLMLASEVRQRTGHDERYTQDADGNLVLTRAEFEAWLRDVRERVGEYWTKDHRQKSTAHLADEVIQHLTEWNLGRADGEERLVLYPALARWTGDYGKQDGGDKHDE